jgi:hypothetical protein
MFEIILEASTNGIADMKVCLIIVIVILNYERFN